MLDMADFVFRLFGFLLCVLGGGALTVLLLVWLLDHALRQLGVAGIILEWYREKLKRERSK